MSDIFSFFKNIFPGKQKKSEPFLHEVLSRNPEYLQTYKIWINSTEHQQALSILKYYFYSSDDLEASNKGFVRVNSLATSGIYIQYNPAHFTNTNFQYLFDFFREKVKLFGYRNYNSDVKRYVHDDHVETLERHYLKPALKITEQAGKVDQLYGNITIEHLLKNDDSVHLKLYAHIYSDRNYTTPLLFDDLLNEMLR